jgi:hypothetical protein
LTNAGGAVNGAGRTAVTLPRGSTNGAAAGVAAASVVDFLARGFFVVMAHYGRFCAVGGFFLQCESPSREPPAIETSAQRPRERWFGGNI